jgi:hypothetical protein
VRYRSGGVYAPTVTEGVGVSLCVFSCITSLRELCRRQYLETDLEFCFN